MWVTADPHFFHEKIMGYMDRPFDSVEEMNEAIIEKWNNRIGENQAVYLLGDVGFHVKDDIAPLATLLARLKGRIHLIIGNHDDSMLKWKLDRWESVDHMKYVKFNKQKYFMTHYAMRTWRGSHRGTFQLYGHSHCQMPDSGMRQMDVGVDGNDFSPWHFDEIYDKLKDRPFRDHHIWHD
jgi:calcineurin-like phosphoesterase family protein